MTIKFFIFGFLITIAFCGAQNEQQKYQGYSLWPQQQQTHMLQMKVLKATFDKGSAPKDQLDESSSEELAELPSTKPPLKHRGEKMRSNRLKREIKAEDLSVPGSLENKQSDSAEVTKTANKRQTSLTGNANRLQNLINLPIQLDVLANVLSKLNAGVLDNMPKASTSNSILGNDNSVSSLVNIPINVDAVVNVLSNVNKGAGSGSGNGGLVDGLLGGLLGGGGGGGGGLLGGLLGGGDQGGLLGNTLGDLLGALLSNDGLLGNLLGGQDGKGLLGGVLNNLLGGVLQLVDNLLELVVGLLDALLLGMRDQRPPAGRPNAGQSGQPDSLINAPIRIRALINVLSTLKEQLQQTMDAGSDVTAQLTGITGGLMGPLIGSGGVSPPAGRTSISGSNNAVSSLLNVVPDVDLNLNVLSQITELLQGAGSGGRTTCIIPGSNPNEICFDIPINQVDTFIKGNNNSITNVINVNPKIKLDLNVLSNVEQRGQATQRVCITLPQQRTTTTAPPARTLVPPVNRAPTPLPTRTPSPPVFWPTMRPTVRPPLPPSPPLETCFYVWVDQPGAAQEGNNNPGTGLINLPIDLNLGVNVLSNVRQQSNTNSSPNLVLRRVCIPGLLPPIPTPIPTTTSKPIDPSKGQKCFRRVCTRWQQFPEYNCPHKSNAYPRYTVARDIY